ncbi:MAG TPA: hypothetical protein PLX23_02840 [Candidatus Hydrogenedens sp.]|nr:hypothetical protein [Candidatus Hydrogenedens sp.]
MKTTVECLVCFMQQAYRSAILATNDTEIQRQIVVAVGAELGKMDISRSPAELSQVIYDITSQLTTNPDPYAQEKNYKTSWLSVLKTN